MFQFYFEGLLRTRLFPIVVGLGIAGFVSLLLFANRMPLAVQRAVSYLPINVDSDVRAEAMGSSEWRFQMWAVLWKDMPKYLVVGKGYSIDPSEMELTKQGIQMGILNSYEESMLAGDYHSGPLSVIIPFGIIGSVAFVWILIAGFRVLYSNYRNGEARLRRINTTLLAYYVAYCVTFFFLFGAFNSQLFIFLGAVGFGISLNGGVQRKPDSLPERGRASLPQAYAMEVG
jgi:O-antigen ligase